MIQNSYKIHLCGSFLAAAVLLMGSNGGLGASDETDAGIGDPFVPGDERAQLLEMGQVIVEEQAGSGEGASVVTWIFIRAPVERIWETIISCDQARYFVAGLKVCEVLKETGDYALTRQVVNKGWSTPKLDYTFATRRKAFESMVFELESGNLQTLKGDWIFESVAGGVVLRHRLELRPLVPVPRWLVRRNLKKDLPAMLICIRALVSGSGTSLANAEERAQCPGPSG